MKQFVEQGWRKVEFRKPYKSMGILNEPAVYLIVLKSPRRKIIYVGSTRSLFKRVCSHQIISVLKRNIPTIKLEVWYKNFRHISYNANEIEEAKLISELNPIFNGTCALRYELHEKTIKFWKSMGVEEVKINFWHNLKVA